MTRLSKIERDRAGSLRGIGGHPPKAPSNKPKGPATPAKKWDNAMKAKANRFIPKGI